MKTFRSLMPGDKIYYIMKLRHFTQKRDQYGNVTESGINFHSMDVKEIGIGKCIYINPRDSSGFYTSKTVSDIEIPSDLCNHDVFEEEKRIYFLDESKRDQVMASMALKEILRLERSIKEFEIGTRKNINEVLKNYESVLGKNYE
jgi:hypothetical protein